MNAQRRSIFAIVCGLALSPAGATAQARTTIAVDATVGGGSDRGGDFVGRNSNSARLAASVRRSGPSHFGFFGDLAADAPSVHLSDHPVVCKPSGAGCSGSYPELVGLTMTAGVIAQPTSRIEARVGVGGGLFVVDPTGLRGTRVGAAVSLADVTWFPVSHVGVVAGARWIAVPRYNDDRLSIFPWAIGLRVR
jgi:hypothetical protein